MASERNDPTTHTHTHTHTHAEDSEESSSRPPSVDFSVLPLPPQEPKMTKLFKICFTAFFPRAFARFAHMVAVLFQTR